MARKRLDRPQTKEERAFYARSYFFLTLIALIFFPPFGLIAVYFSRQTREANKCSDWEDAYLNSSRTIWMDVLAILAGLGIIYAYVLFV